MQNEKPNWYLNKIKREKDYQKDNVKQIVLKLNRNTDDDILSHLETKENKQGYIKELIRKDITEN
jgi:hypothetical protein